MRNRIVPIGNGRSGGIGLNYNPSGETLLQRRFRMAREKREREFDREDKRAAEARYKRDAEARENALRDRIAKGEDYRADKYLHAAARRRRQEKLGHADQH